MTSTGRVAFIDDDASMRQAADQWLGLAGLDVKCFECGNSAVECLPIFEPHAVVTDVRMPGCDGLTLLKEIRKSDPDLPVILITAHGDVPMAVEAMQAGAFHFIEKPYSPEHLLELVERAIEHRRLLTEVKDLRKRLSADSTIETKIVGNSPGIARVRDAILALADTDANVIILGETGTGKELAARCLHEFGARSGANFVAVNCGAVPGQLFESELFGHEKGAFTDASYKRVGKLEHAHGGTLLLDEIESMPLDLQVKLLRAIQEGTVEPLGSNKSIPIDVCYVAATKTDLGDLSRSGTFREDLFYRLNVATITIPPLRERQEDIPLLFDYFASEAAKRHKREMRDLTSEDLSHLLAHHWRGNVRELKNVAERYVLGINATGRTVAQILNGGAVADTATPKNLRLPDLIASYEKKIIETVLARSDGSVIDAVEILGIPRRTLYEKMAKYEIDKRECGERGKV